MRKLILSLAALAALGFLAAPANAETVVIKHVHHHHHMMMMPHHHHKTVIIKHDDDHHM